MKHRPSPRPRPASGNGISRVGLLWLRVRTSLWFVPSIAVAAAVALAMLLVELDTTAGVELATRWPRLFGAGVEGSRAILSAIATSMIGVGGIAFSVTVVALSLASSQYTSRVLSNFMRDRGNQAVLGVFLGVFAYCLVVLRSTHSAEDPDAFVPRIAVAAAIVLALLGLGFFIYFVHHISESIQAETIVERVTNETLRTMDRLYPDPAENTSSQALVDCDLSGSLVVAHKSGYVQGIDREALNQFAQDHESDLQTTVRVGDFVIEGSGLVLVGRRSIDEAARNRLRSMFLLGRQRTIHQDVGFGIRQLVDMALKALSPGINDSTTAVNCVNYLGAILSRLATRRMTEPSREGRYGVRFAEPAFDQLLSEAFEQIRQNARRNIAVQRRLIDVLSHIARSAAGERCECVRRQLREIELELKASSDAFDCPPQPEHAAKRLQVS